MPGVQSHLDRGADSRTPDRIFRFQRRYFRGLTLGAGIPPAILVFVPVAARRVAGIAKDRQ